MTGAGVPTTSDASRLGDYLAEHSEHVQLLAHDAMSFVEATLGGATRMVYVNFNATVLSYSPDGKSRHSICSVVAYSKWVNLCFFVGPHLPDPDGLLQGSGSTVRSVRIKDSADLDARVSGLLDAALAMWPWRYSADLPITTRIVAVSDKRRPVR